MLAPAGPRERTRSGGSSWASGPGCGGEHDFLFVHGSARNPLNEYVFPEDIYNQRKMETLFVE